MTSTTWTLTRTTAVLLALSLLAGPLPLAAQEVEEPPVFSAAKLLDEPDRVGEAWSVQDRVVNDGFLNTFVLDTPDGEHEVAGERYLEMRVREVWALERMREISQGEAFKDAAVEAAKSPFVFAKDMITDPGETAGGVIEGTGRFFDNIGHSLFGSKSEQEEGVAGAALGTAAAKRAFAAEFGIDPYSNYAPLQERLAELAWASFAGGLAVAVATDVVAGDTTVGTVLMVTSIAVQMRSRIYDNAPAQVRELNQASLDEMGIDPAVRDAFLDNKVYSPTRKTMIVGALERMPGVANKEAFLEETRLASDDTDAFLYQLSAELMVGYHENVEAVRSMVRIEGISYMETQSGKIVGVFPNDHLAWTQRLAGEAAEAGVMQAGGQARELWFTGSVSDLAEAKLEEAGWAVKAGQVQALTPK